MDKHNNNIESIIAQSNNNPYQAVNNIAKTARSLSDKYNNIILHSEAINWIISGEKPKIIDDIKKYEINKKAQLISDINEKLLYVDDKEVVEAVWLSLDKSQCYDHLIYSYNEIEDEFRRARVRILTRIIWYKILKHN